MEISVIMPVYNGEKYIADTIDSILNQSFYDFEFIIINDGSNDTSREIIEGYCDNRIVLLNNKINLGIVHSLNRGLRKAGGKYIARIDCDDTCDKERLEKQKKYLDDHLSIGVVGCYVKIIDEFDREISSIKRSISQNQIKWKLLYDTTLMHPSVMFRKSLIIKYGMYSSEYPHSEDYELWSRLSSKTNFCQLSDFLVTLRKHRNNIGVKYSSKQGYTHLQIVKSNIRKYLKEGENEEYVSMIAMSIIPEYKTKNLKSSIIDYVFEILNNFIETYKLDKRDISWILNDFSNIILRVFSKLSFKKKIMGVQILLKNYFSLKYNKNLLAMYIIINILRKLLERK